MSWVIPGGAVAPGTYQVRLFSSAANAFVATSNSFAVTGPSFTVTPASVPIGGTIKAVWSGIAQPDSADLLNLEALRDGSYVAVSGRYLSSNNGVSGSITWTLPTSATAGTYRITFWAGAGSSVSHSNTFVIGP